MVRGIGQASKRKEMSGGGAGKGGRNLDLPNKILLEAFPVSYFIVRSKPVTCDPGVQWPVTRVLVTHYFAMGQMFG